MADRTAGTEALAVLSHHTALAHLVLGRALASLVGQLLGHAVQEGAASLMNRLRPGVAS